MSADKRAPSTPGQRQTPAQKVRRCFSKAIAIWSPADSEYIIKSDLGGKMIGSGKNLQAAWANAERNL